MRERSNTGRTATLFLIAAATALSVAPADAVPSPKDPGGSTIPPVRVAIESVPCPAELTRLAVNLDGIDAQRRFTVDVERLARLGARLGERIAEHSARIVEAPTVRLELPRDLERDLHRELDGWSRRLGRRIDLELARAGAPGSTLRPEATSGVASTLSTVLVAVTVLPLKTLSALGHAIATVVGALV